MRKISKVEKINVKPIEKGKKVSLTINEIEIILTLNQCDELMSKIKEAT